MSVTAGLTREQSEARRPGIVARLFERATMIRVGVDARTEALTKKK
jgi:hypothetical protein